MAATLALGDMVWRLGVADGPAEEVFGRIVDAAFDSSGTAYLLDAAARTVRVFRRDGRFLRTAGRAGLGPGEFRSPRGMVHDGISTLTVFDSPSSLVQFHTAEDQTTYLRTVPLPFSIGDFCMMRDRIYAFGFHDGHVIHELAQDGAVVRSFGQPVGPLDPSPGVRNPAWARGMLNRDGRIACVAQHEIIVIVTSYLAAIRAFRVADGELVWTDSIPGLRPHVIWFNGRGGYSALEYLDGADSHYVLRPLDGNVVLAQARRHDGDTTEVISTCLLDALTGGCSVPLSPLPLLPAVSGGFGLTVAEQLHPVVSLYEVQYTVASSQTALGRPSR